MTEADERPVQIPGPCRLTGRLKEAPGRAGLVLAHPHPLYGGSMDNNVVQALGRAGVEAGLSALKFNFRGVGGSEGAHDQGRGEREDLLAALDYLAALGSDPLWVAGYSFGAWVAATTLFGHRSLAGQIWVSPPVGMMPLEPSQVSRPPGLILYGTNDPFCPEPVLLALVKGLDPVPVLERLAGADHFLSGREREITRLVNRYLAAWDRSA